MTKVLIGVATAALWFVLAHAANAEQVCRQVCDAGTCVSKCVDHPDTTTVIREHEHYRDYDDDGPAVGVHVPGVGVEIGR